MRISKTKTFSNFVSFLISLVAFSTTCLWSVEYMNWYKYIIAFVGFMTLVIIIIKRIKLFHILSSTFFLWSFFFFGVILFYGLVFLRYGTFNTDFIVFNILVLWCLMFLLSTLETRKEIIIVYCRGLAIAAIFISIFFIVTNYNLILAGGNTRIGDNLSGNVNTVAVCMGLSSLAVLYLFITEKKIKYLLILLVSILLILLTGSKKGLITLFMMLFLYFNIRKKKVSTYIWITIASICCLYVIFNVQYIYNIIGFRVVDFMAGIGLNIESVTAAKSTESRLYLYRVAFNAFLEHPIFGGGMNYVAYKTMLYYAHNNYFEILANFGLFGFAIYYSLYIHTLVKVRRALKKKKDPSVQFIFVYVLTMLILEIAMVSYSSLCMFYFPVLLGSMYFYKKEVIKAPI